MKRKTLALSIVIPVYNEEEYIDRCLKAIASQTVPPDEVILVDNNSTDKTLEIVSHYPFVKVVHEPKQGIVYARDRGYNTAKGDIIGRIDGDVFLPVNWVERIKAYYSHDSHSDSAITGGGYPINLRFPRVCAWLQSLIAFRFNSLLLGHYILFGSNMAFTRDQWEKVKKEVCEYEDIHEDLDLAIHLHRKGYKIRYDRELMVWGVARRLRKGRESLLANLMLWPQTLRRHGKKTWILGGLGAIVLYVFSPLPVMLEYLARLIGRPPLHE